MVIEVLNLTEADWEALSWKERIAKCQQFAEEAEKLKQPAMAAKWRELATEMEAPTENSN